MAKATTRKARKSACVARGAIRFTTTVLSPRRLAGKTVPWLFLTVPKEASEQLPSRGMVSVEGALNGAALRVTLEPDGRGGHWMRIDRALRDAAGVAAGDTVTVEFAPVVPEDQPEPAVPADLRKALAAAPAGVREVWSDITPAARRDWIQWIVSAKQDATRARRITAACDMLVKGKRRPCCFDRSGMYAKSISCPEADEPPRRLQST